ncbi:MAG: hypothetical protein LW698_06765 [Planctomycetaceae bacterium]|jgi:hypothetical protein|nr:hypothetical protein [Planctomycetaceae bacterium]
MSKLPYTIRGTERFAFKRSELFKNLAPLPDGEQMSVWGEEYGTTPRRTLFGCRGSEFACCPGA